MQLYGRLCPRCPARSCAGLGRARVPRAARQNPTTIACAALEHQSSTASTDAAVEAHSRDWEPLFRSSDKDGDGLLDPEDLKQLLESSTDGLDSWTLAYISQAAISKIKAQSADPESFGLTLQEFSTLMKDGLLVSQHLKGYHDAFRAADTSGNGLLSGDEVQSLLSKLGQKLTSGKLAKIMEEYDKDRSGQIDFIEFLDMFSQQLLELQQLEQFLHMDAAPSDWPKRDGKLVEPKEGAVTMVFSAEELEEVLQENASRLTVIEASLTWCRPCIAFERTFEKFAAFYTDATFLKFYGNSNESTKWLFTDRFEIPKTPTFLFLRKGTVQLQYTGTRKEMLDKGLQQCLLPEENPLHEATPFKRQIWHSKLGLA